MANSFAFQALPRTQANRQVVIGEWTFTEDGTGTAMECANYTDMTVEVKSGTFGSGTITILGSLDATPVSGLKDLDGNAISKTADFLVGVREHTRTIAPKLLGATDPSLVVRIMGVSVADM